MSAQGNVSNEELAKIIDYMPKDSETQKMEYNIALEMFEIWLTFIKYLELLTTEINNQKNKGRVLRGTMGVIVGNGERYLAELYVISTKIEKNSRDFHMSSKLLSSIMEILQKTISSISIKHFHIVEISKGNQVESKLLQKTYILGILNYFKETSNKSLGELYRALTDPTLATPIEKSAEKGNGGGGNPGGGLPVAPNHPLVPASGQTARSLRLPPPPPNHPLEEGGGGGDMKKKRGHGKRRHITHKRTKTRRKPAKTKKQHTRK